MENLVEWELAEETEVLEKKLPECQFLYHKSHITFPDANSSRRGGKPVTNRLSYGTAVAEVTSVYCPEQTMDPVTVSKRQVEHFW
jgi:hypothetical protein